MSEQRTFPSKKDHLPVDKAIMIKCCYCELADICHRREQKEKYENDGWATRCTITPNRPGKKRKERRRRQRNKK